jgi:integrase
MLDTGMRLAECAGLTAENVSLADREVYVMGKGRRPRVAPFSHASARALDRYDRARAEHRRSDLAAYWLAERRSTCSRLEKNDSAAALTKQGPTRPMAGGCRASPCTQHRRRAGAGVKPSDSRPHRGRTTIARGMLALRGSPTPLRTVPLPGGDPGSSSVSARRGGARARRLHPGRLRSVITAASYSAADNMPKPVAWTGWGRSRR